MGKRKQDQAVSAMDAVRLNCYNGEGGLGKGLYERLLQWSLVLLDLGLGCRSQKHLRKNTDHDWTRLRCVFFSQGDFG